MESCTREGAFQPDIIENMLCHVEYITTRKEPAMYTSV